MIRPAQQGDEHVIVRFIHELAAYERLEHRLDTDVGRLREHLFGPKPCCEALLAEEAGKPVGFALFFLCYSTFKTAPCLWLEDLYVQPQARGRGHGKALLHALAELALARGYPRIDWAVLDWNASAIGFYTALGAHVLPDWRVCRVEDAAIQELFVRSQP